MAMKREAMKRRGKIRDNRMKRKDDGGGGWLDVSGFGSLAGWLVTKLGEKRAGGWVAVQRGAAGWYYYCTVFDTPLRTLRPGRYASFLSGRGSTLFEAEPSFYLWRTVLN